MTTSNSNYTKQAQETKKMHTLELLKATGRHLAACLVCEAESIAVIRILNSF